MSYSGPPIYDGASEYKPTEFVLDNDTRIDVTLFEPLATGGSSFVFKSQGSPKMILKLCFIESLTTILGREIIGFFTFFNRFKGKPIVMLTETGKHLTEKQFFRKEVESQEQVNALSLRPSPIVLTPDNKNIVQGVRARKFSGNLLDSGIFDFDGYIHQFQILLGKIGVDFNQLIGKKIGVIAMEDETEEFPLTISNNNNRRFKAAAFKAWFELCLNGVMHLDPNLNNFIFKENKDRSIEARLVDFENIFRFTKFHPISEDPQAVFRVRLYRVFVKRVNKLYGKIPDSKKQLNDIEKLDKELEDLYGWLPRAESLLFVRETPTNSGVKRKRGGGKSRKRNKRKSKTYKKKPK